MEAAIIAAVVALAVCGITVFQQNRSAQTNRRAERLTQQLQQLYGPLHFFTGTNKTLIAIHARLGDLYKSELEDVKFSDQESTQKAVEADARNAIATMNRFIGKVQEHNTTMVGVIEAHYAFIHPDDVALFQEFIGDWHRRQLEGTLPTRLQRKAEPIAFYRSEFADRISHRFQSLSEELRSLSKVNPWIPNVARAIVGAPWYSDRSW